MSSRMTTIHNTFAPSTSFESKHGGRRRWPLFLLDPMHRPYMIHITHVFHGRVESGSERKHAVPVKIMQLKETAEIEGVTSYMFHNLISHLSQSR